MCASRDVAAACVLCHASRGSSSDGDGVGWRGSDVEEQGRSVCGDAEDRHESCFECDRLWWSFVAPLLSVFYLTVLSCFFAVGLQAIALHSTTIPTHLHTTHNHTTHNNKQKFHLRSDLAQKMPPGSFIAVHAGAGYHGTAKEPAYTSAMRAALTAAQRCLDQGGSSSDAVRCAICVLEVSESGVWAAFEPVNHTSTTTTTTLTHHTCYAHRMRLSRMLARAPT